MATALGAALTTAVRMIDRVHRGATHVRANAQPTIATRLANDYRVVIRFASLPAVVDAQIAQATAALKDCKTTIDVLKGDEERAMWQAHATGIWERPGAVVRVNWLPATLAEGLAEIERIAGGIEIAGRAGIGAGLLRIDGGLFKQITVLTHLRASGIFGNVVIVRGSDELKAKVDVWGSHGDRQPLFDALKRTFDPNGVLNAGRGPL